ncbi:hypothetical protein J6Z39_07960 [bacterium]|nr:hypothetical protein [bacterium]
MRKISTIAIIFALIFAVGCTTSRSNEPAQPKMISLELIKDAPANKYINLDYGIRLNIKDSRADKDMIQIYDSGYSANYRVDPEVKDFVDDSLRKYIRDMGFALEADVSTDYMLQIIIKEFHVDYLSGKGWTGTIMLDVEIYDHDRKIVYPRTGATGRFSNSDGAPSNFAAASRVVNEAYARALEAIDWDRVAFFLHRSSSPKNEANKQVSGKGDTALEHLTIHWAINSRPQGADCSWRIKSSTPDVKNQNERYLSATPYESTETFDIKGLTYNNAGNVQVEVKCTKAGFYEQKKVFDMLSVIDEKEISAMFILVKEE